MKFIALTLVVLLFTSCAHQYAGPSPNLSLRGDEARAEYEKFRMSESYWRGPVTHVGNDGPLYTRDSLRTMMSEVSPRSVDSLDRANNWFDAEGVATGFMLAALVGMLASNSGSTARNVFTGSFYGFAGISIGCSVGRDINYARSGRQFNEDLRERLGLQTASMAPAVNLALSF